MKCAEPRPFADPDAVARKLLELANAIKPVRGDRIRIEKINDPMLAEHKATVAEYRAGLARAVDLFA
jgi:hypothetical protein